MFRKQITEEHVIDIDTWKLSYFQSNFGLYEKETGLGSPLIHKIQQHIRNKDKNAYEPNIVSIGPYHYGAPQLQTIENMKLGYLNYILDMNQEKKLHDYLEAINGLEKQARSCYENEVGMDKTSFVKMLLLDGCFILLSCCGIDGIITSHKTSEEGAKQIIDESKDASIIDTEKMYVGEEKSYENDNEQFYTSIFFRDILLLENQIPFFVLEKIFEVFTGGKYSTSILVKNFVQHIQEAFGQNAIEEAIYIQPKDIYHLLHLCHMYLKPNRIEMECCQNQVGVFTVKKWRGATQYSEARIEWKKRQFCIENPHSLLDIRFNNGTMEIPCFTIGWKNYDLFRNLIAFEKTYPQFGNFITAYVVFLSQSITTPDDVALLVGKEIIGHQLHSDKEISDLFRSLGDDIEFDFNGDYYLNSILNRMEAHYQIYRPRWREWLGSITSKISTLTRKNDYELLVTLKDINM